MSIYNYLLMVIPFIGIAGVLIILHYVAPVVPPKRPRR
jgi:hypothetical protein